MPVVEAETYETLASAVDSPETYSTGGKRKKLRAAFDIASSQITNHVFKFEAENRMMLRRKLNGIDQKDTPEEYRSLIAALKKALASCEPLQSKEYTDEDEETVEFIESDLKTLVECIEKFN